MKRIVGEWAEETFPKSTNASICNHLEREVRELEELCMIPDKYTDSFTLRKELSEEIADCVLLLMHLAHRNGIDIDNAVLSKHAVNVSRKWGEPDKFGVVEHIK
jgi:NTP pyrophosphatase (non-canonical NTP hydrolase)